MENNKLEVEGGELLIKSSKGIMAVIPKDKASWVKEQIQSGKHGVVDKYVNSLAEFKHNNDKAGDGLYANIHAKRERIASGSGERMRSPGEAGAPTAAQFKQAAKTAKAEDGVKIDPPKDWEKFKQFNTTLPANLRDDNFEYGAKDKYDLYGMWQSSGKPGSFEEVKDGELFPLQNDGTYHGFSVGDDGVWLKPKSHPSAWMEYSSTQLDPSMKHMRVIQREDGKLQYVPKTPLLDVVSSYKKSMQSPTYKERLAREMYGDVPLDDDQKDEVDANFEMRKWLINNVGTEKVNNRNTGNEALGEYIAKDYLIQYNPQKIRESGENEESVLAHEYGHSLDTDLIEEFAIPNSGFSQKKKEMVENPVKESDYVESRDLEKINHEGTIDVLNQITEDIRKGKIKIVDTEKFNDALREAGKRYNTDGDAAVVSVLKHTTFDNKYIDNLEKSKGYEKINKYKEYEKDRNFKEYVNRDTEVKARINALRIKANLNHGYNFDEPFDINKYPTLKTDMNYIQLNKFLKMSDDSINKLSEYVAYEPNKTEKQTAKNGMMIPLVALNSKIKQTANKKR